jgi:very-short-patch-repair endonuclease
MSDGQNASNLTQNVHRFAEKQGGHITRQQLSEAGMSRRTVDRWVAKGHLIRVYRGVYAVGHPPTNPIDRAHGALLAGGKHSALSHSSALVLWGVWRRWPHRLELTITEDRRPRGLTIHHSATLKLPDVTTVEGVRVTAPPRTALDHAATATTTQLKGTVDHLRLRHGLRLEQLSAVAERNPTHPGKTRLLRLIGQAGARPSRSGFERRWPAFARRYGLPDYETNATVAGVEVDVLVAGAVIVELDTFETHLLNFESDRERDAKILATTGTPTIRVTADKFDKQPELLAEQILTVAAERLSAGRTAAARSPSAPAVAPHP